MFYVDKGIIASQENFKAGSFAFSKILTSVYPISLNCYYGFPEIGGTITTYEPLWNDWLQMIKNVVTYSGSISYYLFTLNECINFVDGLCFGRNIGEALVLFTIIE